MNSSRPTNLPTKDGMSLVGECGPEMVMFTRKPRALVRYQRFHERLARSRKTQPDVQSQLDQVLSELSSINRALRWLCK